MGFRTLGKVTAEVFLTVLFAAAARISSVSETCRRLSNAPCENTCSFRSLRQLARARRTQTPDQRGLRGTSGAAQKLVDHFWLDLMKQYEDLFREDEEDGEGKQAGSR
jgi:hypothetical protein